MKLKYEPIKIEDRKVYFNFGQGFKQKIFARTFPILIGDNKYQSKAYGVLKAMTMLDKEYFDPFYTIRGAFAEYYAYLYLIDYYKNKLKLENIRVETYENVKFDAFENNQVFGGKPDITMTSPIKVIHEVKSKDIKKYKEYLTNKSMDKSYKYEEDPSEYKQGYMYCVLSDTTKLVMVYVFIPEHIELALKKWVEGKTPEEINAFNPREFKVNKKNVFRDELFFLLVPHKVDIEKTKQELNQAYITVRDTVRNGYIPLDWFYGSEKEELNLLPF